jgi:hypothetical protein
MTVVMSLALLLFRLPTLAQTQTPQPPAADRQWLAGTWTLDRSGPPEDEKNWNRPTGRASAAGVKPIPDFGGTYSVNTFGRTLLAPSETVVLAIQGIAVTIADDFREPTRFDTTGRTDSFKVLTQRARSTGTWYLSPPRSMTVRAKSSWSGNALVQELWTRDLSEIVRITRTFIPADSGRRMLLALKVLEPKLQNPVKDIDRPYRRSGDHSAHR